jgi:dinuclear metal center YbgI/SA1388 family protein
MREPETPSTRVLNELDALLTTTPFPDDARAWNGLQIEGTRDIQHVVAAVDSSEVVLERTIALGGDLLLVHHGLFWDPERRVTGRRRRKLARALEHGLWVYSAHLPLDAHPTLGNAACLLRGLGVEPAEPFGILKGTAIGWAGRGDFESEEALEGLVSSLVGGPVRTVWGPKTPPRRIGVITGAGASFLEEANAAGLDTLITGEAPHHAFFDARELGVRLILAGHYRTETFGVRAVAAHLAERFGLRWSFVDDPSGL